MNYDGKVFRGRSNSDNGEVGSTTTFRYRQSGSQLTGEYAGGSIAAGQLLGTVHQDGSLEFLYQHLNQDGVLMAGICRSVPERDSEGILVLKETWQWLTGDRSQGKSEVEEVLDL